MSFELSFFLGFIFTAGLFVFCLLTVTGAKAIIELLNRLSFRKKPQPQPSPPVKKPKSVPPTVRSIEIDPSLVDKIFVKKSS